MNSLSKGIFWVIDIEEMKILSLKHKCDINGNFIGDVDEDLTYMLSKSDNNFNHKNAWKYFKRESKGVPYNYYPRGRVEIRNKKAIIFANGNVANERLLNWLIKEFNLSKENGINSVSIKIDMSNHYLSYIDK